MNLSDKKATLSFSDGSAPIEFPVYTVSYTHLDVYKRQGWVCGPAAGGRAGSGSGAWPRPYRGRGT